MVTCLGDNGHPCCNENRGNLRLCVAKWKCLVWEMGSTVSKSSSMGCVVPAQRHAGMCRGLWVPALTLSLTLPSLRPPRHWLEMSFVDLFRCIFWPPVGPAGF